MRVEKLETWSGPGQVEALLAGQRDLRAQFAGLRAQVAKVERVQDRHSVLIAGLIEDVSALKLDVAGLKDDVAGLKADVAGLKDDMGDVKSSLSEILRRLPPPAA